MGLLNREVLPDDKDDASEWRGTDDDKHWYTRWMLYIKDWFAFDFKGRTQGKRVDLTFAFFPLMWFFPFTVWFTGWSWWYLFPIMVLPVAARWRRAPTVIFAVKGQGYYRIENSAANIEAPIQFPGEWFLFFPRIETSAASMMAPFYLSRVQYWCRWHFALQWPLIAQGHYAFGDLPEIGKRPATPMKMVNFYRGWHIDELAYWGDGGFLGGVSK